VSLPTWGDLAAFYCSNKSEHNPYFEEFSVRRYNYASSLDRGMCRLVFLKDVLKDKSNKTLCRSGRFIWCKKLRYEGRNEEGFRQVSFTVDRGKKRFSVSENNVLCVPSKVYVGNNKYFRSKLKTFHPFSSVFSYNNTLAMMSRADNYELDHFKEIVEKDNPYKPGTLVAPRLGYFFPEVTPGQNPDQEHPCGIILGKEVANEQFIGREFYRVRFGNTTYEKVHPIQMEILNEV
tara:strand:- start:664 stop:1365 length:702 start_codon:yes stop_codon:yes gene_type:complete